MLMRHKSQLIGLMVSVFTFIFIYSQIVVLNFFWEIWGLLICNLDFSSCRESCGRERDYGAICQVWSQCGANVSS